MVDRSVAVTPENPDALAAWASPGQRPPPLALGWDNDDEPPFLQEPSSVVFRAREAGQIRRASLLQARVGDGWQNVGHRRVDLIDRWRSWRLVAIGPAIVLLVGVIAIAYLHRTTDASLEEGVRNTDTPVTSTTNDRGALGSTSSPNASSLPTTSTSEPPTTVPSTAPLTTVPSTAPLTTAPSTAPPTTVPSTAPLTTVPSTSPSSTWTCSARVNRTTLRAEPDEHSHELSKVAGGEYLLLGTVTAKRTWYLIDFEGTTGWVEEKAIASKSC
jgi:hypothetical protein